MDDDDNICQIAAAAAAARARDDGISLHLSNKLPGINNMI